MLILMTAYLCDHASLDDRAQIFGTFFGRLDSSQGLGCTTRIAPKLSQKKQKTRQKMRSVLGESSAHVQVLELDFGVRSNFEQCLSAGSSRLEILGVGDSILHVLKYREN